MVHLSNSQQTADGLINSLSASLSNLAAVQAASSQLAPSGRPSSEPHHSSLPDILTSNGEAADGRGSAHHTGRIGKVIIERLENEHFLIKPEKKHGVPLLRTGSSCLETVLKDLPLTYSPRTGQLQLNGAGNGAEDDSASHQQEAPELAQCESGSRDSRTLDSGIVLNFASEMSAQLDQDALADDDATSVAEDELSRTVQASESDESNGGAECSIAQRLFTGRSSFPRLDSIDEKTAMRIQHQRQNSWGAISLMNGDAASISSGISSFSTSTNFSTSASLCSFDFSSSGPIILDSDEAGFMEIDLRGRSLDGSRPADVLPHPSTHEKAAESEESPSDANAVKSLLKRRFLSGFLTRNPFRKKSPAEDSAPGWRLFGKVPPKPAPDKVASTVTADSSLSPTPLRKTDTEASTTALILENRPSNLPAKSAEEQQRHRHEYEQMVEAAKKKELKDAKLRKKRMQQKLKYEEFMAHSLKVWNEDILPNWTLMQHNRKAREYWWHGLHPRIRGKVWKLAIGNELNITPELYEICVSRAKDKIELLQREASEHKSAESDSLDRESSVELIRLDVSRTFPQLGLFQKGGPWHDSLHSLLGAYVCHRPDVGYVQGMSFIAAMLILNLEVADAFVCFTNLLNKPCQLAFFRVDELSMGSYFATFQDFFDFNLPKLAAHFSRHAFTPNLYLYEWIFTIFSKSLPLDVASRVWDVFFRDGEEFLFRTALGILHMHEDILLNLDFTYLAQFLTKLPDDISATALFKSVKSIKMQIDHRDFERVLASHRASSSTPAPTTSART